MKCPNTYCGGKAEQHTNTNGGGSRYCLEGCGYYEEFPDDTFEKPKQQHIEPAPPRRVGKKRGS